MKQADKDSVISKLRKDALDITEYAIKKSDPYLSTFSVLRKIKNENTSPVTVLSIGKAAIPMARAAEDVFGKQIKTGLIVTKYHHSENFSSSLFKIIEAGHPVSDENSFLAAQSGLKIAESLEDEVCIVLLSGGGSALFEKSCIPFEIYLDITKKLLIRGANIEEINTVRRYISDVKGGRLAAKAYPAKVITIALSDVLSNNKSAIASGLTVKTIESKTEIDRVVKKYIPEYDRLISEITDRSENMRINDGGYFFAGDINSLCMAAKEKAEELGYKVADYSCCLQGEARESARKIISGIKKIKGKTAYIYGGETTVTVKGNGIGGRNQEMALTAATELKSKDNIVFISLGSDGTDGPTDAAGGIADGFSFERMKEKGIDPYLELENNNSYYALKSASDLIITGPTGTNVNDITLILTDF